MFSNVSVHFLPVGFLIRTLDFGWRWLGGFVCRYGDLEWPVIGASCSVSRTPYSSFVSICATSMLSGECVSNAFKGGLSPCGRICCKFISLRLRTIFSSYLFLDLILSQSAVSRFRSPVMTIVDFCSVVVLFNSIRKASRSLFMDCFSMGCICSRVLLFLVL